MKKYTIKGQIGSIPIEFTCTEEDVVKQIQETLFSKGSPITINGQGEPLPWEKPQKRGRGRPRKQRLEVPETNADKPKTESILYTLKNKLHLMDDQIEAMSFKQATNVIGDYYKAHPKS